MESQIVEFLTTTHGRRGWYGWMYVIGYGAVILGALGTYELKIKRKSLHRSTVATAKVKSLCASAESSSPTEGAFKIQAEISDRDGGLHLLIRTSRAGVLSDSAHCFGTPEELERYLETETVLRLGDFKPC